MGRRSLSCLLLSCICMVAAVAAYNVMVDDTERMTLLTTTTRGTTKIKQMAAHGDRLAVAYFDEKVFIYEKDQGGVDNWGLVKEIPQPAGWTSEHANDLSLYNDILVVGDKTYNAASTSKGSVYIFEKDNGGTDNWGLRATKTETGSNTNVDNFGASVAVQGNILVAAQPQRASKGAVYVYERHFGGTDNWGRRQLNTNPTTQNWSTCGQEPKGITVYGDYAAVGCQDLNGQSTEIVIYKKDQGGTSNWGSLPRIIVGSEINAEVMDTGYPLAMSASTLVVGGYRARAEIGPADHWAGKGVVFGINTGGSDNFGKISDLVPPDQKGKDYSYMVVTSEDGTYVAIGAGEITDLEGVARGGVFSYCLGYNTTTQSEYGQVFKHITQESCRYQNGLIPVIGNEYVFVVPDADVQTTVMRVRVRAAVDGKHVCIPCDAGYRGRFDTSSSYCEPCVRPLWSPFGVNGACRECPPGKYTPDAGQCLDCPRGYYSNTYNATACTGCAISNYTDAIGQTECKVCPIGSSTAMSGMSVCSLCEKGTTYNSTSRTCDRCDEGYYMDIEGATIPCKKCPGDYTTLARSLATSISDCKCAEGYFGGYNLTVGCRECVSHSKCPFGSNVPVPEAGFWATEDELYIVTSSREHVNGSDTHECFPHAACPGETDGCATGYSGHACRRCNSGYFRLNSFCVECPVAAVAGTVVILAPLGVIGTILGFTCLFGVLTAGFTKGKGGLQIAYSLATYSFRPLAALICLLNIASVIMSFGLTLPSSVHDLVIAMNYMSTIDSQMASLSCAFPDNAFTVYYALRNLMPIIGALTFLASLLPLAGIWSKRQSKDDPDRFTTSDVAIGMCLATCNCLSCFYFWIHRNVLEPFWCVPLDNTNIHVMANAPDIECVMGSTGYHGDSYEVLVGMAGFFFVLYSIGIPVLVTTTTIIFGRFGVHLKLRFSQLVLTERYKRFFWWWEIAEILTKFLCGMALACTYFGMFDSLGLVAMILLCFSMMRMYIGPFKGIDDNALYNIQGVASNILFICAVLLQAYEIVPTLASDLGKYSSISAFYIVILLAWIIFPFTMVWRSVGKGQNESCLKRCNARNTYMIAAILAAPEDSVEAELAAEDGAVVTAPLTTGEMLAPIRRMQPMDLNDEMGAVEGEPIMAKLKHIQSLNHATYSKVASSCAAKEAALLSLRQKLVSKQYQLASQLAQK